MIPLRAALRQVPGLRQAAVMARFGQVGRTAPLSNWGTGRGLPVDRWYIERYLNAHRAAVRGRVLEVKSDTYASPLGADQVDVLDIDPGNADATVVGDLCDVATLRPQRYDAAIVTQTLQLVADPAAALHNLLASLCPGGTLLLTVPCLSRVVDGTDRWRWTPSGMAQLLAEVEAPGGAVDVVGLGNGLAARGFLFGLAAEDLRARALAIQDDRYPIIVGARVTLER